MRICSNGPEIAVAPAGPEPEPGPVLGPGRVVAAASAG